MKKNHLPLVPSFFLALALILASVAPASAAGIVVAGVQSVRSGEVILTLDASIPLGETLNSIVYVGFDAYPIFCGYNADNLLLCRIEGKIAFHHAGDTAYFMLGGVKVFFTVPEAHEPPDEPQCVRCDIIG